MKLPSRFTDRIFGPPDAAQTKGSVFSLVYPPVGFFPFDDSLGNGDYHGVYWPIGRENGPPIVCFSSHDAGVLIPEFSTLENWYRGRIADDTEQEDPEEDARIIAQALGSAAVTELTAFEFDTSNPLSVDPDSPYRLCAVADEEMAVGELDSAEASYRRSLEILPEYVAAHFGLAWLLRRKRLAEEAMLHFRAAIVGPRSFCGASFWDDTVLPAKFREDWEQKALQGLRSVAPTEALQNDPLIGAVQGQKLKSDIGSKLDFDLLQTVVAEYTNAGDFADAANIWALAGVVAGNETVSFRERNRITPLSYGSRLAELYDLAGNKNRAELVRNMVAAHRQPEGLHL